MNTDNSQSEAPEELNHTVDESGSTLANLDENLPEQLILMPLTNRPFFPRQAIPMVLPIAFWKDPISRAMKIHGNCIGLVYSSGERDTDAEREELKDYGTVFRIHKVNEQDEAIHVLMVGISRFKIKEIVDDRKPFTASVKYIKEGKEVDNDVVRAYTTALINIIKELLPLNPLYREELTVFMKHFSVNDPARLADFAASLTTATGSELQQVLEAIQLEERMKLTLILLQKELEVAKAQKEIRDHVEAEIQQQQRRVILQQQLKYIQKELGIEKDDRTAEIESFTRKAESLKLSEEARKVVSDNLEKLSVLERGSAEYGITKSYLDWLTRLPWGINTQDKLNIGTARKQLDKAHYGLVNTKKRILEFIAIAKMKNAVAGSIILLLGPPGVGKTSLGRSIATVLGRNFYRFSLGGLRDEAEIKGHRRTYIGAIPGRFIHALSVAQSSNPVIMLDEIDKIGASFQGDPASALLEVLDPEQNSSFLDNYLDVRFDLSNVLFICTANQIDTIPGPLLDRMEVIHLSGYLEQEKYNITKKHLLPKQLHKAGLTKDQVRITDGALRKIIHGYSREAGVRRLEQQIARVLRKSVVRILEERLTSIRVGINQLKSLLGKPIYSDEKPISGIGVVTGLAWTPLGGATLSIEASIIHNHGRELKLSGQLGKVMQESANIALGFIFAHMDDFDIEDEQIKNAAIHLHVPAGATPKDGPSAGITMTSALLSILKKQNIPEGYAMTGEITLTGEILPVGGIQEKILAAKQAKLSRLLLPEANRKDVEELSSYIPRGLKIRYVSRYAEAYKILFA